MVQGAIKDMEEILPKQQFIRIHRSFIIAKKHIEHIENNDVKMRDMKKLIPIGKNYRQDLYNYVNNLILLKK